MAGNPFESFPPTWVFVILLAMFGSTLVGAGYLLAVVLR